MSTELTLIMVRLAVAGALGGLMGGLLGSIRSSLLGSVLIGAIGGITCAAIIRIGNVDPFADLFILNAGMGFSYAWGLAGGFFLGYITTKSAGR
jgi:hypothetical protein